MKTFISLVIISLSIFSCGPKTAENTGPAPTDTVVKLDTFYLEPEEEKKPLYSRLETDGIQIGKVSFQTPFKLFSQAMGKPDSIVDPKYTAGWFAEANIPVKLYYFKGSSYHVFRDTAQMQRLDFKVNPALEFSRKNIRLNSKTTIEDIKEYFPESYTSSIEEIGNEGHIVRLLFYHGQLHLFFAGNQLHSLEYWEPI
ncbi:MAG: hypothetical protein ACJ75J_12295 [Cytophagaceae bacterium]